MSRARRALSEVFVLVLFFSCYGLSLWLEPIIVFTSGNGVSYTLEFWYGSLGERSAHSQACPWTIQHIPKSAGVDCIRASNGFWTHIVNARAIPNRKIIFRRVPEFVEKWLLASSYLSVRMEQLGSSGQIFMKFATWVYFENLLGKFKFF